MADSLDITGVLDGPDGNASDDNVINGGANDDLIILSTDAVNGNFTNDENGNGNTVEFTGMFGDDTIVNFTIGQSGTGLAPGSSSLNDNDILDFTSYLDAAAAGRGSSVSIQDARVDEAVAYSFNNAMGSNADNATVDHNSVNLWDFSDIQDDTGEPSPANFDALSSSEMEAYFASNQGNLTMTVNKRYWYSNGSRKRVPDLGWQGW